MFHLIIGNKNYSSWSMRPWVLMRQFGIPFTEERLRFDSFAPGSAFKTALAGRSPTGKVPLLEHGPLRIWDTLAIAEYLAEWAAAQQPALHLWPRAPAARAVARSVCAEMHSGFAALRQACPLNVEARLSEVGAIIWRDRPTVRADVARLCQMWQGLLDQSGGPMLFGDFSVADAYYAPVVLRLKTYALPLPEPIQAYAARVCALTAVREWVDQACAEADFLDFEEPYRLHR
ncbi:MAG: glutathione S-transferase family protein [Rhodoferax sp.]